MQSAGTAGGHRHSRCKSVVNKSSLMRKHDISYFYYTSFVCNLQVVSKKKNTAIIWNQNFKTYRNVCKQVKN